MHVGSKYMCHLMCPAGAAGALGQDLLWLTGTLKGQLSANASEWALTSVTDVCSWNGISCTAGVLSTIDLSNRRNVPTNRQLTGGPSCNLPPACLSPLQFAEHCLLLCKELSMQARWSCPPLHS